MNTDVVAMRPSIHSCYAPSRGARSFTMTCANTVALLNTCHISFLAWSARVLAFLFLIVIPLNAHPYTSRAGKGYDGRSAVDRGSEGGAAERGFYENRLGDNPDDIISDNQVNALRIDQGSNHAVAQQICVAFTHGETPHGETPHGETPHGNTYDVTYSYNEIDADAYTRYHSPEFNSNSRVDFGMNAGYMDASVDYGMREAAESLIAIRYQAMDNMKRMAGLASPAGPAGFSEEESTERIRFHSSHRDWFVGANKPAIDTVEPDTTEPEEPDTSRTEPDTLGIPGGDSVDVEDSLDGVTGADSLVASDSAGMESKESDEPEPQTKWNVQARSVLSTVKQRAGVDLSGSQTTLDGGLRLAHTIGAYLDVVGTRRMGSNGFYQQTAFTGGYTLSLSDSWDLTGDFTIYKYPNDSVNALAQSPASLSLSADWAGDEWEAGVCLERFLGTNTFTYLTGSTGYTFFLSGDASVFCTPSIGVTFGSSTTTRRNSVRTFRDRMSLSSIVIDAFVNADIGAGFSVFADPTLMISYQKDLLKVLRNSAIAVTRTLQPLVTLGLRYTLRF